MKSQDDMVAIVEAAKNIATMAHDGQYRMDGEKRPYIVHPALVVDLIQKLSDDGNDSQILSAAWLHDVIEDTKYDNANLLISCFKERGDFNRDILTQISLVVLELSMAADIQKEQIRSYQVDKAAKMSNAAKVVKSADQLANIHDVIFYPPEHWSQQRISQYLNKAEDVAMACSDAAPRLYSLFIEAKNMIGLPDLQLKDWEELVEQVADAAVPYAPLEQYSQIKEGCTIQHKNDNPQVALYGQNENEIQFIRIDIKNNSSLADQYREKLEENGAFIKTEPLLDGQIVRELILSAPVSMDVFNQQTGVIENKHG